MGERVPHCHQKWAIKSTQVPQSADTEDNGFSKPSDLILNPSDLILKHVSSMAYKFFSKTVLKIGFS